MKVYIFQAALLCEACAKDVMAYTKPPVGVDPANLDESLYDSDDFPKGPYPQGGGEADTPQHCGHCGVFLENPLTPDGANYVREAAAPYMAPDDGDTAPWSLIADRADDDGKPNLAEWIRFYFAWGNKTCSVGIRLG